MDRAYNNRVLVWKYKSESMKPVIRRLKVGKYKK